MSRLQELEDQLNEIGLRWKAPDRSRPTFELVTDEVATQPAPLMDQHDAENDWRRGELIFTSPSHTGGLERCRVACQLKVLRLNFHVAGFALENAEPDELTRIRESAKAKALASMRQELQGRPPLSGSASMSMRVGGTHPGGMSSPAELGGAKSLDSAMQALPTSERMAMADVSHRYQQQPHSQQPRALAAFPLKAVLQPQAGSTPHAAPSAPLGSTSFLPAGPPTSSSTAASNSTWEGQTAAALVALEGDRRSLQATVDRLSAAQAQVQQQLREVEEQHRLQAGQAADGHRGALLEQSLRHQKEVLQAAVRGGGEGRGEGRRLERKRGAEGRGSRPR